MTTASADGARSSAGESYDRVRAALVAAGRRFTVTKHHIQASCPGPTHPHGDRNPSLSIDYKPHEDATFIKCQGTCDTDDVLAELGLERRDLFDNPIPKGSRSSSTPRPRRPKAAPKVTEPLPERLAAAVAPAPVSEWAISDTEDYQSADGVVLAQSVREERQVADPVTGEVSTEKRFSQRWPGRRPGSWVKRKPEGYAPVLRSLPDVIAAVSYGEIVAVCEGEKDARRHRAEAGMCATTNIAGASNIGAEMLAPLAGASEVHVYVDHDRAGYHRAVVVHDLLADLEVKRIRLFLPAVTELHSDVSDHYDAGYTVDDFVEVSTHLARQYELVAEAEGVVKRAAADLAELNARVKRADTEAGGPYDRVAANRWLTEIGKWQSRGERLHVDLENVGEFDPELQARMVVAVDTLAASTRTARAALGMSEPESWEPPADAPAVETEPPADDAEPGSMAKVVRHPSAARQSQPSTRIPMSRGRWRYDAGERGGVPRGVFTHLDDTWVHVAPLPYVRSRIIRRDGTGRRCGTDFLVAIHPTEGPAIVVTHKTLRDGSWANDLGLPLSDDDKVMKATSTAIRLHAEDQPEREATPRVDDAGRITIPAADTLPPGYFACAPTSRDEGLAAWGDIIHAVAESPRIALTLGASAVAPFVGPLRRQSHIVALFGDSDQGKTTTMRLAGGVWGDTTHHAGVARAWDTSPIGTVRYLGTLGLLPAVFDEAGMAPMKSAVDWGRLVYSVCEGAQRMTAQSRGPGTQTTQPWDGIVLSAGNGRLTEGLGAGKYAGVAKRVIDVHTPLTNSAAQAELLDRVLLPRAFGHAGLTLLERFDAAAVADLIAAAETTIGIPEGGNERTVAKHLHSHIAGAAMLDAIANTGTTLADAATKAAIDYLTTWVTPEHDADRIISAIRDAIGREPAMWPSITDYREHRQPRPTVDEQNSDRRPDLPQHGVNRTLTGVQADDSGWVAVFARPWRELCESLDVDESVALRELHARGVLQVTESRRRRREWTTPIKGIGSLYKLALPPVIEDDDAPEVDADSTGAEPDSGELTVLDTPQPCTACGEPASDAVDGRPVHLGSDCLDKLPTAPTGPHNAAPAPDATADLVTASQAAQEAPMGTYLSRDGIAADSDMTGDAELCMLCSTPGRGVRWQGRVIHIMCWEASTADQRSSALATAPALRHAAVSTTPKRRPKVTARPRSVEAPAVAVTGDGIVLADGGTLPLPDRLEHVGHLAQIAYDLDLGITLSRFTGRDGAERARRSAGQVWIDDAIADRLGINVAALPKSGARRYEAMEKITAGIPAAVDAIRDGWSLSGADDEKGPRLKPWTRVWREGGPIGVQVVVRSAVEKDLPVLADDPDAATLMRRLARFAEATGFAFHTTAQSTGIDWMISLQWPKRDEYFPALDREDVPPPAAASHMNWDPDWCRTPTAEEAAMPYVVAFDRGGSHVAGLAGLELGYGTPEHHPNGVDQLKFNVPGLHLVEVPESGDWRFPNPLNPGGSLPSGPVWRATPSLERAAKLGYEPKILESWVWPQHGRILNPWYEAIRDSRTALDNPDDLLVRDLVKVVYTRSYGQMGAHEHQAGHPGYAPHNRLSGIANATSNLIYRVHKIGTETGRWPLAMLKDTVLYASSTADPATAWPGGDRWFGRGLGQFKPEGLARMDDHARFLVDGRYAGKAHLIDPDEWEAS